MLTKKEIYLRALKNITCEWEQELLLAREYPCKQNLMREQHLFDKMNELKILCIRLGYVK